MIFFLSSSKDNHRNVDPFGSPKQNTCICGTHCSCSRFWRSDAPGASCTRKPVVFHHDVMRVICEQRGAASVLETARCFQTEQPRRRSHPLTVWRGVGQRPAWLMQHRHPSCCRVGNVIRCISERSDGKYKEENAGGDHGYGIHSRCGSPYWLRAFEPWCTLSVCTCFACTFYWLDLVERFQWGSQIRVWIREKSQSTPNRESFSSLEQKWRLAGHQRDATPWHFYHPDYSR